MAHLRVGKHLRVVIDRTARHSGGFEHLDPIHGGFGGQHRVHLVFQRVAVRHARLICGKTRVLAPFGVPQSLGTARPDRFAGGPYHQIAVLGLHSLVGRVLTMPRTLTGRLFMIGEPLCRGP